MRVAIVHDYLTQFGGAERVLLALMEAFENAPVFTLLHNGRVMPAGFDEARIRVSFLQRVPGAKRHHRFFPLLMPLAVEQFDFSEYDVVLSDTHSFTKGIITGASTMHLSYCFTPTRYLWDDSHRYVREFSRLALFKPLAPLGLSYMRLWDYYAAQRVDSYLTLSQVVARRIKKYYHRDSRVVPPPVDVDDFKVSKETGGYYLVVSRLVPYKRVELAIEACERLKRPLKIAGTGQDYESLRKRGGEYVEFLGFVPDEQLPQLYAGCRALLFPQEEDFGITPLEAAAAGKPTVAYAGGGALETVVADETGVFFEEQTVTSLMGAILRLEQKNFDPELIRRHAEKYRRQNFLRAIREEVQNQWMVYQKENSVRL
ncbi:MAG: glycosyltransferase [Candidatus Andersenbacteria bacterium]|nr:glycosyltransferase [bacterium]MDZ4225359.1 glycosyltransferase [Candidatus Andersenbacteria bacterium]